MSDAKFDLSKLTPEQIDVTQNCGTEPPFKNAYWNNQEAGIYVDVVSGKPLFTSIDKFDSNSGWPSFTKPITDDKVTARKDFTHGMSRVEVKGKESGAHLGHVFNDGPNEPGETGLRYCINSASLRFIAVKDLEKEGYAEFLKLFNSQAF